MWLHQPKDITPLRIHLTPLWPAKLYFSLWSVKLISSHPWRKLRGERGKHCFDISTDLRLPQILVGEEIKSATPPHSRKRACWAASRSSQDASEKGLCPPSPEKRQQPANFAALLDRGVARGVSPSSPRITNFHLAVPRQHLVEEPRPISSQRRSGALSLNRPNSQPSGEEIDEATALSFLSAICLVGWPPVWSKENRTPKQQRPKGGHGGRGSSEPSLLRAELSRRLLRFPGQSHAPAYPPSRLRAGLAWLGLHKFVWSGWEPLWDWAVPSAQLKNWKDPAVARSQPISASLGGVSQDG